MEKKKLFEPIGRGASSLPPDFTEELKEKEIVFPYPKKIDENKYEIAPGMYCNKIGLDEFFEEWKRTLGQKKKYRFDNIRFDVMNWSPEVRKTMTKQMIYRLPHGVTYWSDFEKGIIMRDYFGDVIDNYAEWNRQREEYIENLYKELKNEEEKK